MTAIIETVTIAMRCDAVPEAATTAVPNSRGAHENTIMAESILIVDDEASVRRTFEEWLAESGFGIETHAVADAEAALLTVSRIPIDLAILDWNLGSGSDGLRLLDDLREFRPDLVAILITGYASQATPLDALRRGVRDYLDKNRDLTRETFLATVRKQLDTIVPAKRARQLAASLAQFRDAVQTAIPIVRGSAALHSADGLADSIRAILAMAAAITSCSRMVLVMVRPSPHGPTMTVFDAMANANPQPDVAFGSTLAAAAIAMREPCFMATLDGSARLACEQDAQSIWVLPVMVGAGTHAVIEVMDGPAPDANRKAAAKALVAMSGMLLRSFYSEKSTQALVVTALESALAAGDDVARAIESPALSAVKSGLAESPARVAETDAEWNLLTAVRTLALRHGDPALAHVQALVTHLTALLDSRN
jgi:two-component system, NtrC family, nitrogen regulation response regulator NtrX